ncbi:hypothetical protein SCHPADRAFT_947993 [Schizopora paradoxa]|uniref:Uncharacterized protein n=1 Tax=Schizopora paradoxa TaxID=27342 RepID=A0A0H2QWZ6_9AGAM|nr:hypothetical protein SCHPADRAFT_947993 [Schizopora paradoxa]
MASPKPSEDREATGSQRDFYGAASCKLREDPPQLDCISPEIMFETSRRRSEGTIPIPNDVDSLRLTSTHRSARHLRWADMPT